MYKAIVPPVRKMTWPTLIEFIASAVGGMNVCTPLAAPFTKRAARTRSNIEPFVLAGEVAVGDRSRRTLGINHFSSMAGTCIILGLACKPSLVRVVTELAQLKAKLRIGCPRPITSAMPRRGAVTPRSILYLVARPVQGGALERGIMASCAGSREPFINRATRCFRQMSAGSCIAPLRFYFKIPSCLQILLMTTSE